MADILTIENIGNLLMLCFLQAVLGFDNLLYISIQSQRAPVAVQAAVRFWGIIIAVALRVVLLGLMIWRGRGKPAPTATGRAYEAAFQAAGLANLSIVLVFLAATFRAGSGDVWYFYTPLVFALQGAAWFVFFRLRKRAWLGLVALGWFTSAVGLGLTTHSPTYILVASVSLFLLLSVPGWVILRLAKQSND